VDASAEVRKYLDSGGDYFEGANDFGAGRWVTEVIEWGDY
jgi:hypothetical protein